jgi:hypothetical protein
MAAEEAEICRRETLTTCAMLMDDVDFILLA